MHAPRSLSLLLPLFVAPVVGCTNGGTKDDTDLDTQDTDVVDTDIADSDVVDTDVADTDLVDTDVIDTDDTDVVPVNVCGDGTPAVDAPCFASPAGFDGEGTIGALAIADWNGGGADVIYAVGGSVYTLAGDGAGAFPSGQQIPGSSMGSTILELRTGQLDNDAYPDVVVGGVGSAGRVIFNDGAGNIAYETYLNGEGDLLHAHVADIQGSLAPQDVVISDQNGCGTLSLMSGNASSSYRDDYEYFCSPSAAVIAKTSPTQSSVVTVESLGLHVQDISVSALQLTLGPTATYTLPTGSEDMETADLDGDGDDEVLILLDDGTIKVMFSDGAGGWEAFGMDAWDSVPVTGSPTDLTVGDLDGDGDVDVAVASTTDDGVTLLVNDGTGTFFESPIYLGMGAAPVRITAGDLNSDGIDDLAVGTSLGDEIVVLLSNP